MRLSEYLIQERGLAARLARATGLSPAFLSQVAGGVRPCPADRGAAIESATGGVVRRWDLRPADWYRIWPELIGAEGAPPVCAEDARATA